MFRVDSELAEGDESRSKRSSTTECVLTDELLLLSKLVRLGTGYCLFFYPKEVLAVGNWRSLMITKLDEGLGFSW